MANKQKNIQVERVPEPEPGQLGRKDLLVLAIGTVLGTGLLTFLPTGIAYMGTSAVYGFPFAVILGFLYLLPVTIATSILRMGGGLMSLVGDLTNPTLSGLYGLGSTLAAVAIAMYGTTFASYVAQVFPNAPKMLIALIVLTIFYITNLIGIKTMSRVQNIMSIVLIVGLLLFIIMGIPQITQPIFNVNSESFMPNSFATTFAGLVVLFGCTNTFQPVSCMGRVAKNSTKDMPVALSLTSCVIFVLYFLCVIVAAGVLPYEEISEAGTLVPVLKTIFPNWLYLIWLVAIPGLLVFTTLNGLFSTFTEQFAQCARDGWLPRSWAKTNKRGIPFIPLTILYGVAFAFTVTGLSPSQIILCTNILTIVFDVILFIALLKLPLKYEKQWKQSKWHVPYWLWVVLNVIRVALRAMAAYSSIISLSLLTVIMCVALVVICVVWCLYRAHSAKTIIRISSWPAPLKEEAAADEA